MPAEGNLFLILFFAGFTAGVLFLNVWWNLESSTAEGAGLYLLAWSLNKGVDGWDYFWYLFGRRGSLFFLAALLGVTIFGAPLAVTGAFCLGAFVGGVFTLGLLEVGLKGGLLALVLLLPQYVIYLPVLLFLGELVFSVSKKGWSSMRIPLQEYKSHLVSLLLLFLGFCLGLLLEVFVNPWAVHFVIEKLKIF